MQARISSHEARRAREAKADNERRSRAESAVNMTAEEFAALVAALSLESEVSDPSIDDTFDTLNRLILIARSTVSVTDTGQTDRDKQCGAVWGPTGEEWL